MPKKKTGGYNGRHNRRNGRQIRTEQDIINDNKLGDESEVDGNNDINNELNEDVFDFHAKQPISISCTVALWEFGQNDPKRDSGSKMVKWGYAKRLRMKDKFPGIILSSEAKSVLSPADTEIITKNGIAGINCSWNRLSEIPFGMLGRDRNHRKLPLLIAANTVNYGKAYKMNTVEAIASSLYIVGLKDDCCKLLEGFSFGNEFLKLNHEALELYANCSDAAEVQSMSDQLVNFSVEEQAEKLRRKEQRKIGGGGYMDDIMMLPDDLSDESVEHCQEGVEEKVVVAARETPMDGEAENYEKSTVLTEIIKDIGALNIESTEHEYGDNDNSNSRDLIQG